ncbi:helix-turn-helix transcriptional regulator, partial [Frankia sp. CNm7]|uniref:helix-turn-helix domain-containing protein n=1 Tax=Frankia nepalensis TaxID=1836974 RepID=UPI001D49BE02
TASPSARSAPRPGPPPGGPRGATPATGAAASGRGTGGADLSPLDAVDVLVGADVVRPTELPRRFAFRHPIVRHAVYVSAGPGWRLGAHARAAEALAARGAAAIARAHHVERSAPPGDEQAIALLTEAADASRMRAPATAARWYDAALRLLPAAPAAPARPAPAGATVGDATVGDATTGGATTGRATATRPRAGGDHSTDTDQAGLLLLRRIGLLSRLASALDASYQPERAHDVLNDILGLIPPSLPEQRAHVIALRSSVDHILGRHGEARALVLDALATTDPASRAGCLLRLQLVIDHFYTGEYEGMRRWQREAHPLAERLGDPALLAVSSGLLTGAEYMTDGVAGALRGVTEAARRYDLLTDDQVLPHLPMLAWLGWTEVYLERFTEAARHLNRVDALARRRGRGPTIAMVVVGQATLAGWRGRVPEAARLAEAAVESCLLAPHLPFLSWALALRCWTLTLTGDLSEALRVGAHAVAVARPETDTVSVLAGSHYAEALVEAGQPDRAIHELLAATGGEGLPRVEEAYRPYWYELLTRAELARTEGARPRGGPARRPVAPRAPAGPASRQPVPASGPAGLPAAWRWAELAERTAEGAGGGLPGRRASALRARAAVELASGAAKEAAAAALESAAAAERAGLPIESGRSLTLAGRALAAIGDTPAAVGELRRAEARLRAAGASRPGDEAARLLRQLGEKVARGGRPAGSSRAVEATAGGLGGGLRAVQASGAGAALAARLSARERQIAELVAAGQTNKQIAAQLFVSEKTVESHVTKVLAKLGVPSRAAVGAVLRS